MIRTLLWKELRQLWWVAGLGAIGVGLWSTKVLVGTEAPNRAFDGGALQATLPMMAFALGLAIGLVQQLRDARRDRWALLVHQPIDRDTLFRWRFAVGAGLTGLAWLLPMLAVGIWLAWPGSVPRPFRLISAHPAVLGLLTAWMAYGGALFAALHQGPWWGVRLLPLMLAWTGPALFGGLWTLGLLGGLALVAATGMAAASAFRTAGETWREVRLHARLAALVAVTGGAIALGGELLTPLMTATNHWTEHCWDVDFASGRRIEVISARGVTIRRTEDGQELPDRASTGVERWSRIRFRPDAVPLTRPFDWSFGAGGLELDWGNSDGPALWWTIREAASQDMILIGFDRLTNQALGYVGPEGLQPSPYHWTRQWLNGTWIDQRGSTWKIDLGARQPDMQRLPDPLPGQIGQGCWHDELHPESDGVVSVTRDAVVIREWTGREMLRIPMAAPFDLTHVNVLYVGWQVDLARALVVIHDLGLATTYQSGKRTGDPSYVLVDGQGVITERGTLPVIEPGHYRTSLAWLGLCLSPPALLGCNALNPEWNLAQEPWWVLVPCLGTGLMVAGWLARRRRLGLRSQLGWYAIVLVGGPLSVIALRAWHPRQVVPCHACGTPRPLNQDRCPACAADWGSPAADGRELIDHGDLVARVT